MRPKRRTARLLEWMRVDLFGSWWSTALTLALLYLLARLAWAFVDWAFVHPVWSVPRVDGRPETAACRAMAGTGACWAVVREKYRFILFGFYPYAEQWRPA